MKDAEEKKDTVKLRSFNFFPNEDLELATMRPSGKEKDREWGDNYKEWGDEVLNGSGDRMGFKEYCMLDPHTYEGCFRVAEYGGWQATFESAFLQLFVENKNPGELELEEIKKKCHKGELYRLIVELYVEHYKTREVTLEFIEGLSRVSANIEANIGSPISNWTGNIDMELRMTVENFDCVDCFDIEKKPKAVGNGDCIPNDGLLESILTDPVHQSWARLSGLNPKDRTSKDTPVLFFHDPDVFISVRYISNFDTPISEITAAAKAYSQSISDNKHHSSKKDVGTQVAEEVHRWVVASNELGINLAVSVDKKPIFLFGNGYPQKNGKDKSKNTNTDWPYPTCEALKSKVLEDYASNPFDKDIRTKVIKLFEAPSETNESILVQPPFLPTFKSYVNVKKFAKPNDQNTPQVMTVDMINRLLLCFPIIHIYQAAEKGYHNVHSEAQHQDKETRKGLCLYYARYNLQDSGSAMIKGHLQGLKLCNLKTVMHSSLCSGSHNVLTAAIWTVEHVMAKLMMVPDRASNTDGGSNKESNQKVLLEVAKEISDTLSGLTRGRNSDNSDFLHALSKSPPRNYQTSF